MEQSHSSQLPTVSSSYYNDSLQGMCRICHSEEKTDSPLICPCNCSGTMSYVHLSCLSQWIERSGTRSCELCKFEYNMKIEPFWEWKKLKLSPPEKRKLFCFTTYLLVTITFFLIILYLLIDSIAMEMDSGGLTWAFWTMVIGIAIFFSLSLVWVYIQCKQYVLLFQSCTPFCSIMYMHNAPGKVGMYLQQQAAERSSDGNAQFARTTLSSFKTKRLSSNEDEFRGSQSSINSLSGSSNNVKFDDAANISEENTNCKDEFH